MSDAYEKWEIFRSLEEEMRRSIQLAIVFHGNAIFVTKHDEVYGMGRNQNGCLATGHSLPVKEPKRIEMLCGQEIKDLEHSGSGNTPSLFAVTASGSVFAWGKNECGQLGLGIKQDTFLFPSKISGNLKGSRVVQVACGLEHTLLLTSDGVVYASGRNTSRQLGIGNRNGKNKYALMKVGGPLNGKFVTAIACKMHASIALLDSGEVFAWGDNSDDILGLGPLEEMRISIPCKVPGLEEISKIVCGPRHAMALSRDGKLFSWGSNFDGEVGTGPTFELITRPTLIAENIGRIKDVAASNYYEKKPCAAITETDVVFMWGQCRDAIIRSPTKTTFSSLDEVFAKVPTQAATCRALRPEQKQTCSSVNAWLNHFFDDTESADFVFSVEGKKIHVHKLILSMRCAYFRSMYKGSWKESSTSEQTINEYSFTAFYNFLKFFYYDKIDLQPGSLAIFELVRLANFYQMEELQEICEKFMKSNTSVGHAALIYETAVQYGFKELEEFSFSFCMKHFSEVAKTDAFNNLQEDIAKKFLLRAAYLGALAYSS